jgi:hypothetical protein
LVEYLVYYQKLRAVSSVGRATRLHREGQRFESSTAHKDMENISNLNQERILFDEKIKERFFQRIVEGSVYDSWEKELEEAGGDKNLIDLFRNFFISLENNDQETLLALPWELRNRLIKFIIQKFNAGETIDKFLNKALEFHKTQQRFIAYHCTKLKVEKSFNKIQSEQEWKISATELDHRDNDLPMAYYSSNYKNLYREKNPKFLYLVAGSKNPASGHKTDGLSWGRAPGLNIIAELDLHQVEEKLKKMLKEYKDKENNQEQKEKRS